MIPGGGVVAVNVVESSGNGAFDRPAEDRPDYLSRLAADFPGIAEMDLNPIFAYPDGAAAVDVRIKVR